MKLVVAILRSEKLEAARAALNGIEVCLLSVSEVLTEGEGAGYKIVYRGTERRVRRPKSRLEVAVSDDLAEKAVQEIVRAGFSIHDNRCDDRVFVTPMDACVLSVRDLHVEPRGERRPSFTPKQAYSAALN